MNKQKLFIIYTFLIAVVSAPLLSAGVWSDPNPTATNEMFEGVYSIQYSCPTPNTCPDEMTDLTKMVIIGTSTPELLGSGLGRMVTIINPNVGPAYTFYTAKFDSQTNQLYASSVRGTGGQPATLQMKFDPQTGIFQGTLENLISLEGIQLTAKPIMTLGSYLKTHDVVKNESALKGVEDIDLSGAYLFKWENFSGQGVIKQFDSAGYAGRFVHDRSGKIFLANYGMITEDGLFTLQGLIGEVRMKFFMTEENGRWKGYVISTRLGTVSDFELWRKP